MKPKKLLEMLSYMRPEGSEAQREFCERYLEPVMGKPDRNGNYIKVVGKKPTIAFMAHHDTVHSKSGRQTVEVDDLGVAFSDSNCLGADCTTGVWLILEMIEAGVKGVYVVHAAEEVGCIGSSALVKRNPKWLKNIQAAISFDRKGTSSIITHQMGRRTCSEGFSKSLGAILGMDHESDDGGSYTDSNEYAGVVPECTNLSVGYYGQHTKNESQDLHYAEQLRVALINADWSQLVIARDPSVVEYADYYSMYSGSTRSSTFGNTSNLRDIETVVMENPEAIAFLLQELGYDAYDLADVADEYDNQRYQAWASGDF